MNENNYKKYIQKLFVIMKFLDEADFNISPALHTENRLINENYYKTYMRKLLYQ